MQSFGICSAEAHICGPEHLHHAAICVMFAEDCVLCKASSPNVQHGLVFPDEDGRLAAEFTSQLQIGDRNIDVDMHCYCKYCSQSKCQL